MQSFVNDEKLLDESYNKAIEESKNYSSNFQQKPIKLSDAQMEPKGDDPIEDLQLMTQYKTVGSNPAPSVSEKQAKTETERRRIKERRFSKKGENTSNVKF